IGQKPMILLASTTAGVPMSVDLHGGALEDQLAVRLESDLRTAEGHLALGIDDDRTLRLDDELLVEGVEPDGHLALGGRQCDPGDVLRIEQRHAMAETGDDLASRHSAVVEELTVRRRLVDAVEEAADHDGPIDLPVLEPDEDLVP